MSTKTIKIECIHNQFDVRKSLNDDRVIQLAELYNNGQKLPPITVVPTEVVDGEQQYAFVDGRHRAAALDFLNIKVIEAIVKSATMLTNQPLLYAEALRANWGGALPPNRADIEHSITRMLESGAKNKDVKDLLNFLPVGTVNLYLKNCYSTIRKRKISLALEAVSGGSRINEAADKYELDVDVLKDALSGKKRKLSKSEGSVFGDMKMYIGVKLKGANNGIAKKIETLLKQVEEGEVRASVVEKVVDVWEQHLKGTQHRIRDWRERISHVETKR